MTDLATANAYGVLTEPATLTLQRVLPGPIERVWAYLTESDLRRKWLAAGEMELKVGAPFEFVWRNDELTSPSGPRPEGSAEEHRLQCAITELDPPKKLAITWGSTGGVTFTLESIGTKVLLTLVHRRVPDRSMLLNVSSGWHTHLDILAARMAGEEPKPFWD
ncbi:MAG TPA: SRPBCC family protein, partial [Longimicrobiales bacterium]|nr:SRPBCC family protein [Longimicrobiales bacterium]